VNSPGWNSARAGVRGDKLRRRPMDFERFLDVLRALARERVDDVLVGSSR
jgi:hypothetical protein